MMTGGLAACDWLMPVTRGAKGGGGGVSCGSSVSGKSIFYCALDHGCFVRGMSHANSF